MKQIQDMQNIQKNNGGIKMSDFECKKELKYKCKATLKFNSIVNTYLFKINGKKTLFSSRRIAGND